MEKKLPKLYANRIDKSLDNNKNVFYSKYQDDLTDNVKDTSFEVRGENINQKINFIFGSPRYVYKADVDIKTRDGWVSKRIIGKNSTHLITFENELISISDIKDIKFHE